MATIIGVGVLLAVLVYMNGGIALRSAKKGARVSINNTNFVVDVARTAVAQARGLSGRPRLGDNEGMLFVFSSAGVRSFWMKDMLFPLDIIWIRDGRIIGFVLRAEPEPEKSVWNLTSYESPEPADAVFEINAGLVERFGFAVGDAVRFTDG